MIQLIVWQGAAHNVYGGPRRYLQTFIHPDVDHMRKAARRYSGNDFSTALGVCHPAPVRERYDKATDTWTQTPYAHRAGIVRLVAGHVTTEIVAHEFTHAALAIYRMDVKADVRLSRGCADREETLAYIVGDLIASASNRLHAAGAWSYE